MDLRNQQSHCSAVSGKELSNRGKGILLPACSLWVDFKLGQNDLRLGEVADLVALTFNLPLNPPFCQTAANSLKYFVKPRYN